MEDIANEWSLLAQQASLKSIQFHSVAPYPDEDMVTGTADLIRIAVYYADAIYQLRTERFHEETRDLESMLTQLQAGRLCAH